MKLFAKYNRVNLVTTIAVLLITGLVYYQAISLILTNLKDKDLNVEEQEAFDYVRRNHSLPQTFESNDQQITFTPAPPGSVKREYINTVYFKKKNNDDSPQHHPQHDDSKYESGRGLISSVTVGGKYYKILIVESVVETEDLIRLIFIITISVILFSLLVLLVANRLILSRLWRPFYSIMRGLREFNIADNQEIEKPATTIDEFNELNNAVAAMTSKAKNDYTELKTFTENAAHELLTPIAVINSKLDTLIQTENFSTQQSNLLNDLYSAVSRLNRLNQSLLLLVKIENRLLQEQEHVNLRAVTEGMISQFEEIFHNKNLKLTYNLADKEVDASLYLVDILLSNLISNAIRHNNKGGNVAIDLTGEHLVIKNTGTDEALPHEKIFTRFHKSSGSEGSGLGLTISRQICENFNFSLTYDFREGYHIFIVTF